jgi:hypothetical protein
MDGFDFHPYPIPQSMPYEKGYAAKNNVAVSNRTRIYQAFYDAFDGTAQKTIGQQSGGGLPVSLNEVGIQTLTDGHPGYTGNEVSTPTTGVLGDTATEAFQAQWYLKMLDDVSCDPNIQVVNIFHLVDESELGAWQSGLFYVGYAEKASAGAVRDWISETGGACSGAMQSWTPGSSSAEKPSKSTSKPTAKSKTKTKITKKTTKKGGKKHGKKK